MSPVVDVHIHHVPVSLVAAAERGEFSGVRVIAGPSGTSFGFPGMDPSPPAPPSVFEITEVTARFTGIDTHLVGPWTDLLGYTLPAPVAATWTRAYNEALVSACSGAPNLFPVATVPMQHPELAAAEAEAAARAGCRGVMIGTEIPGHGLDSAALDTLWQAAARLSLPVILHPTFGSIPPRLQKRGLKNTVGRVGPLLVALTELLYAGVLARYESLTVIAALGGGGFPVLASRILRNHELGHSGTEADVAASIRRLHFDTCVGDSAYLAYLVSCFGPDRVLLGSDHPFPWESDPLAKVAGAGLSPAERDAVLGANAVRLFGLSAGAAAEP